MTEVPASLPRRYFAQPLHPHPGRPRHPRCRYQQLHCDVDDTNRVSCHSSGNKNSRAGAQQGATHPPQHYPPPAAQRWRPPSPPPLRFAAPRWAPHNVSSASYAGNPAATGRRVTAAAAGAASAAIPWLLLGAGVEASAAAVNICSSVPHLASSTADGGHGLGNAAAAAAVRASSTSADLAERGGFWKVHPTDSAATRSAPTGDGRGSSLAGIRTSATTQTETATAVYRATAHSGTWVQAVTLEG